MGGGKRRRKNSDKRPKEDDKKTRKEADFVATNLIFDQICNSLTICTEDQTT